MRPDIKRYLEKIDYDPKNSGGGYSGVENLFRAVKKDGKHGDKLLMSYSRLRKPMVYTENPSINLPDLRW